MCSRHLDMNLELMHQVPTGHLGTYAETQIFELRRGFFVVFLRLYSFLSVRENDRESTGGWRGRGREKNSLPVEQGA